MKCERCGTESFDVQYVQYREGDFIIRYGWLCTGCREGVST